MGKGRENKRQIRRPAVHVTDDDDDDVDGDVESVD